MTPNDERTVTPLTPKAADTDVPASAGKAGRTGGATVTPIGVDPFEVELTTHFTENYNLADLPSNHIIERVTNAYLATLDPDDTSRPVPDPAQVEAQLLAYVNNIFNLVNIGRDKVDRLVSPKQLTNYQVAQCLLHLHHIVRIAPDAKGGDRQYDMLAMYVPYGPDQGTYTTSEHDMRTVARRYNLAISLKDFAEVSAILTEDAPRTHVCHDRDLIAVNNGVFNYSSTDRTIELGGKTVTLKAKSLIGFSHHFVFLAKSRTDYRPGAVSPVITHPIDGEWEVEQWVRELSDDPEIVELIWEILGAIIRPHVRWNKAAWFYSEKGNNGKGTLCALMRNLTGPGTCVSIPLSEFGSNFALEPLVRATAIVVDENDVDLYIDKAARLKAIVTNDPIQIDRKFRPPISLQFWGFMVQCINGTPRVKDKSESFYRRQLFVNFEKSFTGVERKYIKDDYLGRREVLEYVLHRVLHMDYYSLSEPESTKAALAIYKEANDPVRAFWGEFRTEFAWDLLPFNFLYALFLAWYAEVSPKGSPVSQNNFTSDLVQIVDDDPDWHCADPRKQIRPGGRMDAPEPLIAAHSLKKWLNPHYTGADPLKQSMPVLLASYRGLLRTSPGAAPRPFGSGLYSGVDADADLDSDHTS